MRKPTKNDKIPPLRLHKATGVYYVNLDGARRYLCKDSEQADRQYQRLIAEWLANGRTLPIQGGDDVTVAEVVAGYFKHAKSYYRLTTGAPTSEIRMIKNALEYLDLYLDTAAVDFGPLQLRACRQRMIDAGLSRSGANKYTARITRCFTWAASEAIVPAAIPGALRTVPGLRAGRTEARETEPVKPVPEAHVAAVLEVAPERLHDMIRIMLLTACRPGEVLALRAVDIDCTGKIWTATLTHHKTAHHQKARTLYFGPQAQTILRRRMLAVSDTGKPLFGFNAYTTATSAHKQACKRAGVPHWALNRLRHNAATMIRKTYGLEAAQVILGHSRADVTQIYAEADQEAAIRIIAEIG